MKTQFKKGLFEKVIQDLSRPHSFAFERVGYLFGGIQDETLRLDDWLSFDDSHYEENDDVGARIGVEGMTYLMKKAFVEKKHFFHTHLHDFQDIPTFSGIDLKSLLEVTPSLFDFSGKETHGAILIGREKSKLVWWTEKKCKAKNELLLDYGLSQRSDYEREK